MRKLKDNVPVLFKINMIDKGDTSYFYLENEEYSVFPKEEEVLLGSSNVFSI